ncbi:MAG: hypothetical protein QNK37_21770 [Acidobacteriota bacterium]|nr:hypothetical protein [Acidobacteriota bacterium]
MDRKTLLIQRLDRIAASLASRPDGLALLGLGSAGLERDRLDDYSDLDFFAIVAPGSKQAYLQSLDWLKVAPVAYAFRNTKDGFKLLYQDGVFCEFAVFTPDELSGIPFSRGKLVWHHPQFDPALAEPKSRSYEPQTVDWHVGEALTNLYIGLSRLLRGENLAATRFVQSYAVDRVLALTSEIESPAGVPADNFDPTRRFEQRFPETARHLPEFLQGYTGVPVAARAILTWLDSHFEVNSAMKLEILNLCGRAESRQPRSS